MAWPIASTPVSQPLLRQHACCAQGVVSGPQGPRQVLASKPWTLNPEPEPLSSDTTRPTQVSGRADGPGRAAPPVPALACSGGPRKVLPGAPQVHASGTLHLSIKHLGRPPLPWHSHPGAASPVCADPDVCVVVAGTLWCGSFSSFPGPPASSAASPAQSGEPWSA